MWVYSSNSAPPISITFPSMMSNTYNHLRRTNLANQSVMPDVPASTKNPAVVKMIAAQSGAPIHEEVARPETVVAHEANVVNLEHYSVE